MYNYVTNELPTVIGANFADADVSRASIFGHSMGGHGALTIALKNPQRYRSVSAFAPIVAPSQVPWGQKALPRYLGDDANAWRAYDTVALLEDGARFPGELLVDQGEADKFFDVQLQPQRLEVACAAAGQALRLRLHAGYDHSYWFIQSFVEDHLRHHARVARLRSSSLPESAATRRCPRSTTQAARA
jgi:S-formylglutathione hydrolase